MQRAVILVVLLVGCPDPGLVGEPDPTPTPVPDSEVPPPNCTLDRTSGFGGATNDGFRIGNIQRGVFLPRDPDLSYLVMETESGELSEDGDDIVFGAIELDAVLELAPELQDGSTVELNSQMVSHESGEEGFFGLYTPEGALLYQQGFNARGGAEPMWGVSVPADGWCPTRSREEEPGYGCNEFATRKPVEFTRGDASVTLYQGQEATVDGYRIQLHMALVYSGDEPEDKCLPSRFSYTIVRAQ